MEKLKIDNFLGLNDIDLEINEFNILIGPLASGKSVIAKLLYFSKSVFEEIKTSVIKDETIDALQKNLEINFIDIFPENSWKDDIFIIEYISNDYHLSISNNTTENNTFTIDFLSGYSELLANLLFSSSEEIVEDAIKTRLRENFTNVSHFSQLYIPAGRSLFSLLQSSVFSILSDNNIDPILKKFGSFYERLKLKNIEDIKKNLSVDFNRLSEEILLGDFITEKGKDYLVLSNGRKLNLSYCSSGQQEILPLILVLTVLSVPSFIEDGLTVFIEEPEVHIFPLAQKKLMEMLIQVFNKSNGKIQFFITTHSPYILTSTNNHLLAGLINRDSNKNDKLLNIVGEESILKPTALSAYSIVDGNLESIIDEESELILGDLIDDVSNVLGKEFEELLDLVDYEN